MELVVRKADLLRELQLFQGIVERKNTIPILANVLIEADGTGADAGDGSRGRLCAAVARRRWRRRGSLTLPAKKLYEIIKALPETDVRIEAGQERRQGRGGPLRLADADAAARRFPDAARRRPARSARRCRATC